MGLFEEAKDLPAPKDDVYTAEDLKAMDGSVEGKPVAVSVKGTVFDVSSKREVYGPGAGYHVFAGKDASNALGKSSLRIEDAHADTSSHTPEEAKVLDEWFEYYRKRYPILGTYKA